MSLSHFPENDLDRPEALFELLGTHWSRYYPAGRQFVRDLLSGLAWATQQIHRDFQLAALCVDRHHVPPFRTIRVLPILLKEGNQKQFQPLRFAQYDSGHRYDTHVHYDTEEAYPLKIWPLATETVRPAHIRWITNRLTYPSVVWIEGLDFLVKADLQELHLLQDPFSQPELFAIREVLTSDGFQSDRELLIWGWEIDDADTDLPYEQLGYVLGLKTPQQNSQRSNFCRFLNHYWDALVAGTTAQQLYSALAALLDVPLPRQTERVEDIWREPSGLRIATDQSVYRFHETAEPLVAIGDLVQPQTALTNAFQIYELGAGSAPPDLPFLSLDRGFLLSQNLGPISFPNREVPLKIFSENGKTRVEFEISGWPADVRKFFDELQARGLAQGQTLAQLLDIRPDSQDEPSSENLPATINPLKFLVRNVLRYHATLVRVRAQQRGPRALDWRYWNQIRNLLPPHTALILLLDQYVATDLVDGSVVTEENSPRCSEQPLALRANALAGESVDPTWVAESPTLQQVGLYCAE